MIVTNAEAGQRHNEFLQISKMISRQSSMSMSSRIYYRSSGAAGIPFTWEMLPGEPKQKSANDGRIRPPPPLSPPPALQSLNLPKVPNIQKYIENKKSSTLQPYKLLMKISKKMRKKEFENSDVEVSMEGFEFERSADHYYSSPCSGSSSSSLSASSPSPSSSVTKDRASWSIGRMVVACALGTKRI